ncbi:MAG TPA: glycosyltransferase family 1 protein [Chitinophagaceae bacterium]|nr:glycosyltransferase family 1 protein [Chitinophagaceae bacterium]
MSFDILCFSHLRWNFVYQRPQHLISRFGKNHRVLFFEEPEFGQYADHYTAYREHDTDVYVITPKLNHEGMTLSNEQRIKTLLDQSLIDFSASDFIVWYYTPMALQFSSHLEPLLIVYDCMDELSAFRNAPVKLIDMENELFKSADVIFTGGYNLYEHKRQKHHHIFPFPSSIDKEHFFQSRKIGIEPEDQKNIPGPKLGFYGVIDERFDIELLREVAERKPEWNFVLIGPVVKIDPADLPARENIHYLGQRTYKELPLYLSGWDIAIMPFAVNESTRFISPTKTPEYLAGGKPVISTPIVDVARTYGEKGLVHIIGSAETFISAAESILDQTIDRTNWLKEVDTFLATLSWDDTWSNMYEIILKALMKKNYLNHEKNEAYV